MILGTLKAWNETTQTGIVVDRLFGVEYAIMSTVNANSWKIGLAVGFDELDGKAVRVEAVCGGFRRYCDSIRESVDSDFAGINAAMKQVVATLDTVTVPGKAA